MNNNSAANKTTQLILISGLSGSGKSVALKALEDSGYYCIDNLPVELIVQLTDYLVQANYHHIAISVDVRSASGVTALPNCINQLKQKATLAIHLLFLDAHNDILVKRFSETRRLHPLHNALVLAHEPSARAKQTPTLRECILFERELLAELNQMGHVIDTSELNSSQLRRWVKQFIELDRAKLTLLFQSFGFKHGIALDADIVFDVRCLPNPHYIPELKALSGQDQPVVDFLEPLAEVQKMYQDICDFIEHWLPNYIADNRSYLTVGIGCTGGQHRSVYLVEKLAQHFQHKQQVLVRHRQLV